MFLFYSDHMFNVGTSCHFSDNADHCRAREEAGRRVRRAVPVPDESQPTGSELPVVRQRSVRAERSHVRTVAVQHIQEAAQFVGQVRGAKFSG